jgi:hypothetical protein
VTAYERDNSYTITHHKAGSRIDTLFHFKPFEGGTKVTIEFTVEGEGAAAKLLSPVGYAFSGKVREILTRDLADLKSFVEHKVA